jgi:hypothetical protein
VGKLVGMNGRVRVLVDKSYLDWLEHFREEAVDAFGPADDDIVHMIKESFQRKYGTTTDPEAGR